MLAPTNQNQMFPVSRKWQTVSKAIQKTRSWYVCGQERGNVPLRDSLRAGNR